MNEEKKEVASKEVELIVEKEESPEFGKAFKLLKEKLINVEVVVSNIMTVVKFTMEVVELTEVKGEEQKTLAVKLIKEIIIDAPILDEKEKLLLDMVEEGVVGSTIDLVVAATRGQLNINAAGQVASGCCAAIIKKFIK